VGRLRQELLALKELIRANDEKSQREATERSLSVLKMYELMWNDLLMFIL